jgi:ADP-heptose:LPS heptosyltransferase
MSAASRFFREMLGAEAFQLCDRVHEPLWAYNPYIGGAPLSVPMHLDTVWRSKGKPFFSGAFFIESCTEWDNDSEQPNVYDRLFGMLGLNPSNIPDKFKRPVFSLHNNDIDNRLNWLKGVTQQTGKSFDNGYFFVQLRATNKVRSIPLPTAEIILSVLNEEAEKRNVPIIISDDTALTPEFDMLVRKFPNCINAATALNSPRAYAAMIAGALLVLGPDSSAIHFAAAFETATIGIWGPFSPESRAKYYPRQIHLHHTELCSNCPCYNYLPELPVHKCPRGMAQPHCEVYDGITASEVSAAIRELIH